MEGRRRRGGGGENKIGMNGKVWRKEGTELEDEEKIGKGGQIGVRTERGRGGGKGEERRLKEGEIAERGERRGEVK